MPFWSPQIFSIQDYLLKLADANIPDQITLLFELYEVYHHYFPNEEFDAFYPWGELLIKDFDDLDKYLAPTSKVFATVNDLHQIDADFGLPEEDMERLKLFWRNFFEHDLSRLKSEFVNTWKNLNDIYTEFRTKLKTKGWAYEGMAYRNLAENLTMNSFDSMNEYSHTVFAGFYAMSPAEEKIMSFLINEGKASSYWDTDSYYTNDHGQEAGKFIRENRLIKDDYKWKSDHFKDIPKKIQFAGIPLMVGQTRYAGQILQEMIDKGEFVPEKTAVVLPDEKLLFPVLYSIPEAVEDINVTMGYPLRQTPLFNLFETLTALQKNARLENDGNYSFYFRDVKKLLDHTYIRLAGGKVIGVWLEKIKENYIRISSKKIIEDSGSEFFKLLFTIPATIDEVFAWSQSILRTILEAMSHQDFKFHRLESEFIYTFFTQLKRLEDILLKQKAKPTISTFWKIFKEVTQSVRIPFSGEPLKGLQVMGFLETRVLDFENVILLSVNEDVLPAAGNSPSFIPFNIRKAFGLPTYEEQHAVSAFHFYRLLQRAKNIFLLYNTEPKALTAGERSRFLLQIEHELKTRFPESISITKKVITTPILKEKISEITIEKSDVVLKELYRYSSDLSSEPKAKLSASGLQSYIACPLRFYFRYIAGLSEIEELEENMEAATFGKVLHKAMQLIYTELHGIDEKKLQHLKSSINTFVDQAIHEEFLAIDQLEGKNILLRNVIRELISQILDTDKEYLPFKILQLEKMLQTCLSFSPGKL
ncbi:MAG: PD-(D/E)XK nuclease family protein [Bacteroidetes bacterium]|nr:PD-(D/E)XK nuclease family protein [Bacteroidota bacterium]